MTRMKSGLIGFALAWAVAAGAAAASPDDEQYQAGSAALAKGERAKALAILKPLAEKGRADAQLKLAVVYFGGSGVAKDNRQVTKWYIKAAEGGNADAQYQLATAYRAALYDLPRDYQQALKWFRAASDQGHAAARLSLAVMYEHGWGTEKDIAETVRLTRQSAELGDVDAQVYLGRRYELGDGVPQDYAAAAKWYRMAADKGSYMAKSYLKSLPATATVVTAPPATTVPPTVVPATVAAATPAAAPKPEPRQQATAPKPVEPSKPLVAAPVAAAKPAAIASDSSFDVASAPAAKRGKSEPIVEGRPGYGYVFTHSDGLYTWILPKDWSWAPDKEDPRAAHFRGSGGNYSASCAVTPMDYWRGPKSLGELQAIPESEAREPFEKGLMGAMGWDRVDNRRMLALGDGGSSQRTPVKAMSWSGPARNGAYETAAVVETPANALLIMCNASRANVGERIIRLAFQLGEGSMTPRNGVTATSGDKTASSAFSENANKPDRFSKLAAATGSSRNSMPPGANSVAAQASMDRQRLEREFDAAVSKGDRNLIYALGPKLKHLKFCQYVYGDPSAAGQQLYDGASSCPAGPMFDNLTQRYVKNLPPPTMYSYGAGSSQSASNSAPSNSSAPTNWTQFNMQTKHATDNAIRQMNQRIDNAGR
ncbi:MAG: sel1 repeat family protein [Gammaproteobacteria bacterium]|nr:sel1 repeat family protein [Gammaproteobacteria bacterium]MBU1646671.1 sel1 repeat family protein [Gammaproteobacteria bacterium]MBU1971704.1 sel1 repeat family protein [Gammaproteobacteria bacterium]